VGGVSPAEGDVARGESNQPAVGDGDAMGVCAEIAQHMLWSTKRPLGDVSNDLDAGRTRATFSISFASDPANISKARVLVQRDLADMQAHDASTSELQQAKALLIREIPLAESSESDIAEGLLDRSITGMPLDEPILAARRYLNISADEVRTAFAKWIRPNDFVEVVQGPPPQ
jgi:zinc protease